MPLNIACQMDDIADIDIAGDSTFALLLEAQKRGHSIFYYLPGDLVLDGATVQATGSTLSVSDTPGRHFALDDCRTIDLTSQDVVLLRQDPPFDMAYITTTHILERIHPKTLVVNNPAEVRNAPEKLFVLDFLKFMPPTLITRRMGDVEAFQRTHKDIIIKPLYGNGGAGVFRIQPGDSNLSALVEMFQDMSREPFMVQQFRPEVSAGDKRIILVDGAVAGVVNRVPPKGQTRSNLHVGGAPAAVELTARDYEICAALGPELKKRGLIFTGIDVIGAYLTEINVTSPTGIRHIAHLGGPDIAAMIWDAIEAKVA